MRAAWFPPFALVAGRLGDPPPFPTALEAPATMSTGTAVGTTAAAETSSTGTSDSTGTPSPP